MDNNPICGSRLRIDLLGRGNLADTHICGLPVGHTGVHQCEHDWCPTTWTERDNYHQPRPLS